MRLPGGSDGNARLTAATAAVLLVLLAAEGLTLLGVRQLLLPHIFIGLLLVPVVLLKLASTGWRMASYYRRVEDYVRDGPPALLLRALIAPVTVLSTVLLFGTGVAAAALGHGGLILGLHKASFIVWVGAMSVHVLAHLRKLPRLLSRAAVPGRSFRRLALAGALVAGLGIGLLGLPLADHWHGDRWQDRGTAVIGLDAA